MSVKNSKQIQLGVVGFEFSAWYLFTDDTATDVQEPGYINNNQSPALDPSLFTDRDFVWIATTNSGTIPMKVLKVDGVITLAKYDIATVTLEGHPERGIEVNELSPGTWDINLTQNLSVTGLPTFSNVNLTSLSGFSDATNAVVLSNASSGELSYLTPTSDAPRYLSNGSGGASWSQVDLEGAGVTGILPIASGGTNSGAALASGFLMTSEGGAIVEINQDVSVGGFRLTNLGAPINPGDSVNKSYADNLIGDFSVKTACIAGSTTALPASTYFNGAAGVGATLTADANGALPTVGGVSLSVNDRFLYKDSVNEDYNGIYTVTNLGSAGTPWVVTRATDFDNVESMKLGASTLISSGTLAGSTWSLNSVVTTVGSDPIVFDQVGGAAAVTIMGTTNQITANLVGNTYTLSTPQDIALTSSPTFSGMTLTGLTATQLVATNGSKALVSLAYSQASTASTVVQRDSNANVAANRFIPNSNTQTIPAPSSLMLSASSPQYQFLDPEGDRAVVLPSASAGMLFVIKNTGTTGGTLIIYNASAVQIGNPLSNGIVSGYFFNGTNWITV